MNGSLFGRDIGRLVERVVDSSQHLELSGFTSCLCNDIWVRNNSSPGELAEYECVRRSYIEEVLYSPDPADILMSDPGEYSWRTLEIAQRIQERYRKYGAVRDLFADPARRHLLYLSHAEQRLGLALERANYAAIKAARERVRIYQEQRDLEMRLHHAEVAVLRSSLSDLRSNEIEEAFSSLLKTQVDGVLLEEPNPAPGKGKIARIPFFGDWIKVVMTADHDSRKGSAGRIFIETYIDERILFLSRALPMRFDAYKSFDSDSELALCLLAWVEILSFIARP